MMKRYVMFVLAVCVLAGSVSAVLVPLAEWKMDSVVDLSGREAVQCEVDGKLLALGESAGPFPVLTADGGGASGLAGDKALDFTSDVAAAYCNDFRVTDVDLAFDFWIKPTDLATEGTIMFAQNSWEFRLRDGKLIFYVKRASDGGLSSVRTALTQDEWHHVYAQCVGEDFLMTVDDVTLEGTAAGGMKVTTSRLYMGIQNGRNFKGMIDELNIYEVVPEPATMMLLGLGGLLLRRKRS